MTQAWTAHFLLTLWRRTVSFRDLRLALEINIRQRKSGVARQREERETLTLDQLLNTADSIREFFDITIEHVSAQK